MTSRALSLYRSILRLHRQKLPSQMRLLGDAYVKHEFRAHRDAKPEFLAQFFDEWDAYAEEMAAAPAVGSEHDTSAMGRNLSDEELATLSDEQQVQVARLSDEVKKPTDA